MLLAQRTIFNISLVAQLVKNPACNVGDLGLISGLGRSPGEGKGYPLQYSGLENSMDYVVSKSRTPLIDFHFNVYFLNYILLKYSYLQCHGFLMLLLLADVREVLATKYAVLCLVVQSKLFSCSV